MLLYHSTDDIQTINSKLHLFKDCLRFYLRIYLRLTLDDVNKNIYCVRTNSSWDEIPFEVHQKWIKKNDSFFSKRLPQAIYCDDDDRIQRILYAQYTKGGGAVF